MNKRSRVLYTRDAMNTLQVMLLMWSRDCTTAIAQQTPNGGDLGSLNWGDGVMKGTTGFTTLRSQGKDDTDVDLDEMEMSITSRVMDVVFPDEPLPELHGEVTTSSDEILGQWTLVTLENAAIWLRDEFLRVVRRMRIYCDKATIPGRTGRVREFMHWSGAILKSETYIRAGIERLQMVCLTQSRRVRGPQRVQTRREINVPYYAPFRFNGSHATRLPPGRPALSEAEWLRRYHERRRKQRKTSRRVRAGKRPEKKAPRPKYGRPDQNVWAKLLAVRSIDKSGPTFAADETLNIDELIEEVRADLTV